MNIVRADKLALLDVDDFSGAAGFEKQIGLAAEKRGDLQDIDGLGRRRRPGRFVDVGEDGEAALPQAPQNAQSFTSCRGHGSPAGLVRLALSKEALKTQGKPASAAMAPMASAMRLTCSSLSMTHGPAISTSWDRALENL